MQAVQNYKKGRGAQIQVPNKFENTFSEPYADAINTAKSSQKTKFIEVYPKTIVNKVPSPDLNMQYSMNPYQGCEHGCIYCYARNSHEFWGYNAGLDFERVILVKKSAPKILERHLMKKTWKAVPIALSGNTDCYQPVEQHYEISKQILQVFLKYKHPVSIITKNDLILRDLDILKALAEQNLVHVSISLTGMDEKMRQKLEPRTSTYRKRLRAIEQLSSNGIPVNVMLAPLIPSLNTNQIMNVAKSTSNAGALSLGYTIVRLNGQIGNIFKDWLQKTYPERANKILNQIKALHGGQLNDSRIGVRMRGEGNWSKIIQQQIKVARQLYFKNRMMPKLNTADFHRQQLELF